MIWDKAEDQKYSLSHNNDASILYFLHNNSRDGSLLNELRSRFL